MRRGTRRCGRHDVVEEAALLVVRDEQRHPAPHLGVRGEDVDDLRDVPGAVAGLPVRVLGERLGRDDPGDLRQPPGGTSAARSVSSFSGSRPSSAIDVPVRDFWYMSESGAALRYLLKYSSELSPSLPMYGSWVQPHDPEALPPGDHHRNLRGAAWISFATPRHTPISPSTHDQLRDTARVVAELHSGVYETVLTSAVAARLAKMEEPLVQREDLRVAEVADRIGRLVAQQVERAIEAVRKEERVASAMQLAHAVLDALEAVASDKVEVERPLPAGEILSAIGTWRPDGTVHFAERPLIPLLDTTLLTNAPGEPRVGSQILTEIESADSIDLVMAFIRKSGVRPLMPALRRHCEQGKRLRVLTTTYTGSTEEQAIELLIGLGAEVRVSYDVSTTRLHAKSWLFHRQTSFSTAYVAPQTSPTPPRSPAWSGTFESPPHATPTSSTRSAQFSKATGKAWISSTTTERSSGTRSSAPNARMTWTPRRSARSTCASSRSRSACWNLSRCLARRGSTGTFSSRQRGPARP